MLIPFGVLSAAGAGVGVAGDYELIATEILTASQASITFSNLGDYSSTYKHLQIRGAARIDRDTTFGSLSLTFNSDTGNNYAVHTLDGNGSSVASASSSSIPRTYDIIITSGLQNTANSYGGFVCDILDVYATKNKTIRALSGFTGGGQNVRLGSGLWNSTASVTSIQVVGEVGNIVAGTRLSLYGIKG
jgi:hypothetical protein